MSGLSYVGTDYREGVKNLIAFCHEQHNTKEQSPTARIGACACGHTDGTPSDACKALGFLLDQNYRKVMADQRESSSRAPKRSGSRILVVVRGRQSSY